VTALAVDDLGHLFVGKNNSPALVLELDAGKLCAAPGKGMVVEMISVRATVPVGQRVYADAGGNGPGGVGTAYLPLSFQGTFNGLDVYVTTQPLTLYVSSSGGSIGVHRNSTSGNMIAEISVIGHYQVFP
jgi:hypothetical protein